MSIGVSPLTARRKRPHQGKNTSDQAHGMDETIGPTTHRRAIADKTCSSATPRRIAQRECCPTLPLGTALVHHTHNARQKPSPSLGTACCNTTQLCPTAPFLLPHTFGLVSSNHSAQQQHSHKSRVLAEPKNSTFVSMNQCVHHDDCHCLVRRNTKTPDF